MHGKIVQMVLLGLLCAGYIVSGLGALIDSYGMSGVAFAAAVLKIDGLSTDPKQFRTQVDQLISKTETLIESLRASRLIGAAEALVQFHDRRAIPWLIDGLEDAFKRDRFALAVQEIGTDAISCLVETLTQRRLYAGQELLPSLERRATALELLARLGARAAIAAVRTALEDPSDVVRTEAALAYVMLTESKDDVLETVPTLLADLTHPDFVHRDRCAEALIHIGPRCLPLLRQAMDQGGVMVRGDAVPLTINARQDLLRIVERVKESIAC